MSPLEWHAGQDDRRWHRRGAESLCGQNFAQPLLWPVCMKMLLLSEVKLKLSQLVEEIVPLDEEMTITRHGEPVALLVSPYAFDSWQETLAAAPMPNAWPKSAEAWKVSSKRTGCTLWKNYASKRLRTRAVYGFSLSMAHA